MKAYKIPMKKTIIRVVIAVFLVAAAVYATPKVLYSLTHESTDDAFVEGTIVPVSAEVRGKVARVFVENNRQVRAGEPLLEIETEDYAVLVREKDEALSEVMAEAARTKANLEVKSKELLQARANLAAAEAAEKYSAQEKNRYAALRAKSLISQSQYDQLESRWIIDKAKVDAAAAAVSRIEAEGESLKAQEKSQLFKVNGAKAALELARLNLRRTTIVAPISGRIARKNADSGKYTQPGQTLLTIVDEKDIWIVANFKETQLKAMRKGQPAEIRVDAYPDFIFKGHVDSFQPGTGAIFSLLPPENATGNFVKVVQRVAVKLVLDGPRDSAHPLWPGLSVIPYVDTSPLKSG